MKAYVPYEKLGKKQKKELDCSRRAGWGEVNPVTRRVESAKIYNRKKHRNGRDDCDTGASFFTLWAIV